MVQIQRRRLAHGKTKKRLIKGADHATISILGHCHGQRSEATQRICFHCQDLDRSSAHDERGHEAARDGMRAQEFVTEKWSEKYKRSINCRRPRGFSQRAHCAGRKKTSEEQLDELTFRGSECTKDCSGHRAGYDWWQRNRRQPQSRSVSFDKGAAIAAAGG